MISSEITPVGTTKLTHWLGGHRQTVWRSWVYFSFISIHFSHLYSHPIIYFRVRTFSPYPIKAIHCIEPRIRGQEERLCITLWPCPWEKGENARPLLPWLFMSFIGKSHYNRVWNPKVMTGICLFLAGCKSTEYIVTELAQNECHARKRNAICGRKKKL